MRRRYDSEKKYKYKTQNVPAVGKVSNSIVCTDPVYQTNAMVPYCFSFDPSASGLSFENCARWL